MFALRLTGGFGLGNIGGGARGGGAGEFWITEHLGLGLLAGELVQDNFRNSTGGSAAGAPTAPRNSSGSLDCSAGFLSPTIAGRLTMDDGYFLGTLGGGYYTASCHPDAKKQGFGFNASLGYLFRPGGIFEIGPVLRLDLVPAPAAMDPFDALVTVNLELGFSAPN